MVKDESIFSPRSHLIAFFFFFYLSQITYAQDSLHIMDADTKYPVPNVLIRCHDTYLKTNANGTFPLSQLGSCDSIHIIHPEYEKLVVPYSHLKGRKSPLYLQKKTNYFYSSCDCSWKACR